MKRDMDLIRSLLLQIEEEPQRPSSFNFTHDKDEEEEERILCHLVLLHDAGYINYISAVPLAGQWNCMNITMTWDGYEFVDTLRDPDRWQQAKGAAAKAGGVGFKAMVEIGKAIAKGELQKLGIPIG